MVAVAVIPARGGSKRLPNKNILQFCGRPLIEWTIAAALEAKIFARVLVSTDSQSIADVSVAAGAFVPALRDRHFDDHAPVAEATLRCLDQAEEAYGERYDLVAQLMPNCPLRSAADILQAVQHFNTHDLAFQISCFRYGWMNPWWAARLDANLVPTPVFSGLLDKRSQDLPDLYCPSGAIWLARSELLRTARTFYGPGHIYHPMDWRRALDIDDQADFDMAVAIRGLIAGEGTA